jgi:hypothetical protein
MSDEVKEQLRKLEEKEVIKEMSRALKANMATSKGRHLYMKGADINDFSTYQSMIESKF